VYCKERIAYYYEERVKINLFCEEPEEIICKLRRGRRGNKYLVLQGETEEVKCMLQCET
jgi:hypothetical protein